MDGYQTVTSLTSSQIDDLMSLYASTWWAAGRDRSDVEAMLESTDLVVGLVDGYDADRLVAFARVLTDRTYIALVLDVIVAEPRRGQAVGALLMDTLLAQPELQAVRSIELVCQPEMMSFYEQCGFTADVGRSGLMRLTVPPSP